MRYILLPHALADASDLILLLLHLPQVRQILDAIREVIKLRLVECVGVYVDICVVVIDHHYPSTVG